MEGMLASGPPYLAPLFCFHSINRGGSGRRTPPSHFNNNNASPTHAQGQASYWDSPADTSCIHGPVGGRGGVRKWIGAVGGLVLNVWISSGSVGSQGVKCHNPGGGQSSQTNARPKTFLHFHSPPLTLPRYPHPPPLHILPQPSTPPSQDSPSPVTSPTPLSLVMSGRVRERIGDKPFLKRNEALWEARLLM